MKIILVIGFFLLTTSFSASGSWIRQAAGAVHSSFGSNKSKVPDFRSSVWDVSTFNRMAKDVSLNKKRNRSIDEKGNEWTCSGQTTTCRTPGGVIYTREVEVESADGLFNVGITYTAVRGKLYTEDRYIYRDFTGDDVSRLGIVRADGESKEDK